MPPGSSIASRISTSWPRRRRCQAQDRPAGPAPTTSTFLPVGWPGLPSSPSDREIAEKALDGMDGDRFVELGAAALGLARVIAGAAVNAGQRIVGDEGAPGLPRRRPRACAPATPGCSRRPGRRCCRAADGRSTPGCCQRRGPAPLRIVACITGVRSSRTRLMLSSPRNRRTTIPHSVGGDRGRTYRATGAAGLIWLKLCASEQRQPPRMKRGGPSR